MQKHFKPVETATFHNRYRKVSVVLARKDENTVTAGVSVCSEYDPFNRKLGRAIAMGRATVLNNTILVITNLDLKRPDWEKALADINQALWANGTTIKALEIRASLDEYRKEKFLRGLTKKVDAVPVVDDSLVEEAKVAQPAIRM